MARGPESKVKDKIRAYLRSKQAYVFNPVQMGYGASTLDILACVNGVFVGIEVKRPGLTEPSKRQAEVIKQISQAGGLAFTTDSLERTQKFIMDHCFGAYDGGNNNEQY